MKLDSGKAWNEATGMMGANRELVLVIAGVFFFVPMMILLTILFAIEIDFGSAGADPNPELVSQQIGGAILESWWAILLVTIGQLAGALALLSLLGDRQKPTVGEVMGFIPKLILTMIAAQIISTFASQALTLLVEQMPASISRLLSIPALVISLYIAVKFSLISAVVAIEKQVNPITALMRSWQLTKGNSWRIFAFIFLLTITAMVVMLILALSFGLVFSLMGERFAQIGIAIVLAALISGFYALVYAVVAAIHRQLSGPSSGEVAQTFD